MVRTAVILLLGSGVLCAETPANATVLDVFRRADRQLTHFAVLQRTGVTGELDLVIAFGSPQADPIEPGAAIWWDGKHKMGLFLQEKARFGRVYSLDIRSGFEDCGARIERATATDTVISCRGEKTSKYPNQKWVYDVRAKNLVRQVSYQPFEMHRVFPNGSGAVFVGNDRQRLLAVGFTPGSEPEFRILSDAESAKWLRQVPVSQGIEGIDRKRLLFVRPETFEPVRFGPAGSFRLIDQDGVFTIGEQPGNQSRSYPLPQDAKALQASEMNERIGPWKLEGNQLWFGKTFYDGEGQTGVGGFGYFDATDRQYHLFTPPEITGCSVSAIDVALDAVWMALVRHGEWGDTSGGLLRYDRQSGISRKVEFQDIGARLLRVGGKILAATDFGIAVVDGDSVKRYFIDRTTDGRLRIAPAVR